MSQPSASSEASETRSAPTAEQVADGVSAFLARVLDQLSITSWLPSLFLVGNVAILLAFQGKDRLDLAGAIQALVDLRWGALVVLLFALIIVAIVIQAFEFENLRFWEGYWRSRPFRAWGQRRIRSAERKRAELARRHQELERAAFDGARRNALDQSATNQEQMAMWNAFEKVIHGRPLFDEEVSVADEAAVKLEWPLSADPVLLHELDIVRLKLEEYPEAHRLLPTRLGNVMRAAEDCVELGPEEDLEGFMIRHMDTLPRTVVAEHGAYRRRLEMYCSLMFALVAPSAISVFCLWGHSQDLAWRVALPTAYLLAVPVSYRAAKASALGFGQALREASRRVALIQSGS